MGDRTWRELCQARDWEWYREYERRVAEFFKDEGITNLSTIYDEETGEMEEKSFSWHECHCCWSPLGGDRYHVNGYNPGDKEIQDYNVCVDCLYYAEYGQLDDMTMMDLGEEDE